MKVRPSWLGITGIIETTKNGLRYDPYYGVEETLITDDAKMKLSVLRSNVYFEAGEISGEIKLEDPKTKLQFRLGSDSKRTTFVGCNIKDCAYGIAERVYDGGVDRILGYSGDQTCPPKDTWFPFSIRVNGSQVELYISGIRAAEGSAVISRAQLELVFQGKGPAEIRNIEVESVRPRAFIVMQFTTEYDALYREVIAPVCTEFGYEVIRGDDINTTGLIIEDIVSSIRDASIVIADITPNNANVYYEVGFSHGIGKPTILLSDRQRDKLPFDISGFRLLYYDNTIGGKTSVETALRKHLKAIRA